MAKQKTTQRAEQEVAAGASTKQAPRQEMVRKEILEAQHNIESGYLTLAKLLSESYHREYYAEWGFKDFREYADAELGMHYRKAMYLVEIWDKVKSLNLSQAKVEKLGWTKMKDLAAILTAENAKEWMEKAAKMTSRELGEAVKVSRSPDRTAMGTVPHITTMKFSMGESEANIITEAIEEAKRLTSSDSAVVALEMICQEWLESKGVAPQRTSLDDHIKYLKRVYGVDITWASKTAEKEEKAANDKARGAEARAEKKAAGRKEKGKEQAAPEEGDPEDAPATGSEYRDQDINSLLGMD